MLRGFTEAERAGVAVAGGADEGQGGAVFGAAMGGELRPVEHGLRRRDAGIRVAHVGHGNEAAFENDLGFDPEEGGFPDHGIGQFSHFDAADFVRNAVGAGGVDGVF